MQTGLRTSTSLQPFREKLHDQCIVYISQYDSICEMVRLFHGDQPCRFRRQKAVCKQRVPIRNNSVGFAVDQERGTPAVPSEAGSSPLLHSGKSNHMYIEKEKDLFGPKTFYPFI